jgi:hypothetical protein
MSIAVFTRIAAAAQAGAQAMVNYRIQLVGHQLTAQLNKKIAQLKDQSNDPSIPILQQQATLLQQQQKTYSSAHSQLFGNGTIIGDLSLQLSNLAVAAQAGNSSQFDTALAAAQTDVNTLTPVPNLAGFQPDGVAPLKFNGLGIKSSATYNLGTPQGRAQAQSDIQAAQSVVSQLSTSTLQNQAVADAINQSIDAQLTAITDQIDSKQLTELGQAADQISKLKQQEQEQFHVIELAFSTVGQSAGILSGYQTSQNIDPPAGSIISVLVGQKGPPQLMVATLPPVAPPTVGSKASSHSSGSNVSLTA